MSQANDPVVLLDFPADGVAVVRINRPEAKNALNSAVRHQLAEHFRDLARRDDIRAIVLTGGEQFFVAGADIREFATASPMEMYGRHTELLWDPIARCPKPVIAAVNGFAAGAGFSFALLADFILATPRTRFANSFVRIGFVPDWAGLYFLPRIVGLQKAKELVFSCRQFGAEEAKKLGIVHQILPEESFLEEARAFAGRFRDASPSAIGIAKNALNHSFEHDHRTMLEIEAFSQAVSYGTEYHRQAVDRFVGKEPPRFNWEAFEARAAE